MNYYRTELTTHKLTKFTNKRYRDYTKYYLKSLLTYINDNKPNQLVYPSVAQSNKYSHTLGRTTLRLIGLLTLLTTLRLQHRAASKLYYIYI